MIHLTIKIPYHLFVIQVLVQHMLFLYHNVSPLYYSHCLCLKPMFPEICNYYWRERERERERENTIRHNHSHSTWCIIPYSIGIKRRIWEDESSSRRLYYISLQERNNCAERNSASKQTATYNMQQIHMYFTRFLQTYNEKMISAILIESKILDIIELCVLFVAVILPLLFLKSFRTSATKSVLQNILIIAANFGK